MRTWILLWLLFAAVVATFTVVNWPALSAQTAMNVVFGQITAPLGLVMPGSMVAAALLFLVFLAWLETKTLVRLGPLPRPDAAGDIARSSIAELQSEFDRQMRALRSEESQSMVHLGVRLDHLEHAMGDALREFSGAHSAH